ncbi:hypothetical protein L2E82_00565 [Cichorium intybus]|uniref:Uncharacterized protein n=1 Tax=Cichorium intybus TaxID=13427 RepID=A0ACB9GX21_CICIN|nr:hypothetical protein L2E82_00565 [Cichorium intybus]
MDQMRRLKSRMLSSSSLLPYPRYAPIISFTVFIRVFLDISSFQQLLTHLNPNTNHAQILRLMYSSS